MVDIPGNKTTTSTITVGGTVTNELEIVNDHDWFKINLSAGQSISVSLDGLTLVDPYLRIYDSDGNLLYENDDVTSGTNRDSLLAFTATYTGAYYIDVGAWEPPPESPDYPGYTGTYQLSVSTYTPPPLGTAQQLAEQLTEGYWGGEQQRFDVTQGDTITVNLTGLTSEGQNLALQALQSWSQIIGVTFSQVTTGGQITFDDNEEGAFSDSTVSGGFITSSHVNVSTDWLATYGTGYNTYSFQTYIHEIGHALGLGHQGNYNGDARYPYDAVFQNDSWAMSVMSYFSQTENTYFAGQGFDENFLATPMMVDILAMSMLYGLSTAAQIGDSFYTAYGPGEGAVCIFDTGGIDTISAPSFAGAQRINLNPGTFSNLGGSTGNLSIAFGVMIENAVGAQSADTIIGNSASNFLDGAGGNDTLNGNAGTDTLSGGTGTDVLTGGSGNDIFRDTLSNLSGDTINDLSGGDKIVFSNASLTGFSFSLSGNTLTYTGGSLTLAGFTGQLQASAVVGGGVQLTVVGAPPSAVRNDFNGDGRSDILWRNDDGTVINWLGQVDGGFVGNAASVSLDLSDDWQIQGVGDFDGDGRCDILGRNDDGVVTDWLGQANGGFAGNSGSVFTDVSDGWQVQGIGDFNGDGRDDILWRNNSGFVMDWLGQANGGFVGNSANLFTDVSDGWQVQGIGDFNGDGRDDILWRNNNGIVIDWLGQANGGFVSNAANLNTDVSDGWQVQGIGDFNGDDRDDILWRNNSGVVIDWLGQPNGGFTSNAANLNVDVSDGWQVEGIGDYNGDGRDDVLWRNNSGVVIDWLGQANGGFASNAANLNIDVSDDWHVQSPDLW